MIEISKERILDALTPHLPSGKFFWRRPHKYHAEKFGTEAGCARRGRNNKFYWYIRIDGKTYKRAHLIFCVTHGHFASPCIDHINGNSLDDRPCNLREATVTENAWNHKGRARRHQLPMGVRLIPKSGRYQARISCNKKQIHLGAFDTPEEAHGVYLAKRKELFGEFA